MREPADEVEQLQTRSLTGSHRRPFAARRCPETFNGRIGRPSPQGFLLCLTRQRSSHGACRGKGSLYGHSGDAGHLDAPLFHVSYVVRACHEDHLAQVPPDHAAAHRPSYVGELRRADRIPTDIARLRSDLHANSQILSQLSARVNEIERRQAIRRAPHVKRSKNCHRRSRSCSEGH
jgi:hypothetical protein